MARTWDDCGNVIWGGVEAEDNGSKIVAEWVEQKRIKGWIAVFGREDGASSLAAVSDVFATREQVIAAIHRAATGIIEIDVLEGHGLQGEAA